MGTTHRWIRHPLFLPALGLGLAATGCDGAGNTGDSGPPAGEVRSEAPLTPDEAGLGDLARAFMAALSNRDVTRLDAMLAPGATLYSVREGESGPIYGLRTREEFLDGLSQGGDRFLERIWDPVVEVRGRTGMVWAPYDFHLNGTFSHCGIDVLTLLRLEEGWKVTTITYDVVREGCQPSPLGAPEMF